jgi:nucleoside-triphosphatase THEP1
MTNPFRVPGLDDDPMRPLCPWDEDTAEHEQYYVPIDHTAESFASFTEQMANPDGLRKNGRLVLVAGQGGCGKTSLINRCANWLRKELQDPHGITVKIINLTKASSGSDTVPDRMMQASRRLADEIKMGKVVPSEELLEPIMASRDRFEELYPRLSRALNDKLVLAVLLPPIDLVVQTENIMEEIRQYSRMVDGKLVMFIEVTLAEEPADRLAAAKDPVAARPLVLPVRPLKDGDAAVFSDARVALHGDLGGFPRMTREAKEKIDDNPNISVSFLQNLLYHVYEERRQGNDRYSDGDVVSYADITDYVFRHSDVQRPRF